MQNILPFYYLLLLFSFVGNAYSQEAFPVFRQYSTAQGINQPFPYDVLHSKNGYVWIAGENGLYKFDGKDFTHYYHQVGDSNSLAFDFVWVLFEDRRGNIWAGTYGGGLSKYDPTFDRFTNYAYDEADSTSLSDNRVRGIAEDPDGNIWLGTSNGLCMLDTSTQKFTRYLPEDGLLSTTVRQIKLSSDRQKLYIGTGNGLNIFDLKRRSFEGIRHTPEQANTLSHFYVYDLHEYPKGTLWIGTGEGLDKLDISTGRLTHLRHSSDPKSISHDVIFSINNHPDHLDKLFVGTLDGLNVMDLETETFTRISSDRSDPNKLQGDNIYRVSPGRDGSLWVAVYNEGIFQYHPHYHKFNSLRLVPDATDKYYSRVSSMIRHDENEYLFTTYSGLFVKDFDTGKTQKYTIKEGDQSSVNRLAMITRVNSDIYWISTWAHFVYEWNHRTKILRPLPHKTPADQFLPEFNLPLLHDSRGRTWIGNSERGLFIWNPHTESPVPFPLSDTLLNHGNHDEFVSFIFEDSQQRIWVGSQGGLNLLHEADSTFTKFAHEDSNSSSLSNNKINHISEDHQGNLWISTEMGLNKFNPMDSTFTSFYTSNGLPSNVISSCLEDNQGNMWIATAEGISMMKPNGEFRNYNQQDGLMDNYFIFRAAYKSPDGQLFFGSSSGLEYFDPAAIPENNTPPVPKITGIDLFNTALSPDDSTGILQRSVEASSKVTFAHDQSVISFHFTALNFINGHKNKFRYRLSGYDKDWRPVTSARTTTYTNLSPGHYTFQVMACNNDGIWSTEEASLAVTILPPWHGTWWFKLLVTIAILGGILYQYRRVEQKQERLENLVIQRTAEIQRQKEQIEIQHSSLQQKNQRIENLLKELNHRVKNNLQLVSSILNLQSRSVKDKNAKTALIDGKMRMQALSLLHQKLYVSDNDSQVNCNTYISDLFDQIEAAFKSQFKSFRYVFEGDNFSLGLDKAIPLGLILNELITNSFKHVQKEEIEIFLSLKLQEDIVHFSFSDNGSGLTESLVMESDSFGLSMIRSLVMQLHGKLDISESPTTQIHLIFKKQSK